MSEYMQSDYDSENFEPKLIAVASGKGGVGKSVLTAAMGAGLAMLKRRTVVVDADFGGANLHQVVGIPKPAYTYLDFQSGRVEHLNDIVVEHPKFDNLGLIFGAAGSYGMANEKYFNRQKFLNHIRRIDAEYVFLDLGAGSNYHVLDLFSIADFSILVINPDPLSLSESFNFIKQIVVRNLSNTLKKYPDVKEYIHEQAKVETFRSDTRIFQLIEHVEKHDADVASILKMCLNDLQIGIILNKVTRDDQIAEAEALQKAIRELLSVETKFLGSVHYDDIVPQALSLGIPFITNNPKAIASRDLSEILIQKLMHRDRFHAFFDRAALKNTAPDTEGRQVICSIHCLYWEECGYRQGGYPCRIHYMQEMGFQGEAK